MVGILALIGVILLALAGFNVGGPRFSPGWLGLAFISLALAWDSISNIAG